jgi:hypothetical protein
LPLSMTAKPMSQLNATVDPERTGSAHHTMRPTYRYTDS